MNRKERERERERERESECIPSWISALDFVETAPIIVGWANIEVCARVTMRRWQMCYEYSMIDYCTWWSGAAGPKLGRKRQIKTTDLGPATDEQGLVGFVAKVDNIIEGLAVAVR